MWALNWLIAYNNRTKSKQKLLISESEKEDIDNEGRAKEIQSLL